MFRNLLLPALIALGFSNQALASPIDILRQLEPEQYTWYPQLFATQITGEPVAADEFVIDQLYLYGLDRDGKNLWRWRMLEDGPNGDPATMELPSTTGPIGELLAIHDARKMVFVEDRGDERVLHVANMLGRGELGSWSTVPLPEGFEVKDYGSIGRIGPYLLLWVKSLEIEGALRTRGWMANLEAPEEVFSWEELPLGELWRDGAQFLSAHEAVFQIGGVVSDSKKTTQFIDSLNVGLEEFSSWERIPHVLPFPMEETIGDSFGSAMLVTMPNPPQLQGFDQVTSMTMAVGFDWRGGSSSPWRELILDAEPIPVVDIAINPAFEQLLVIQSENQEGGERMALRISGHKLPNTAQRRRLTAEDLNAIQKRRFALDLPVVSEKAALDDALENKQYLLMIVTKNSDEDLDVRYALSQQYFRYMSMGISKSYFTGANGDEMSQRYNVGSTPAFLLVDPVTKEVISRFEGSIPDREAFLSVTSPARKGRPAGIISEEETP